MSQTFCPDRDKDTEAKTLTRPSGVEPQKKRTAQHELDARVVLISPYGPINVFIENEIRSIIPGGFTDIISAAEINRPPYLNARKREEHQKKPFWIIDLGGIIAAGPNEVRRLLERRKEMAKIVDDFGKSILGTKYNDLPTAERTQYLLDDRVAGLLQSKLESVLEEQLPKALERADNLASKASVIDVVPFHDYLKIAIETGAVYITPTVGFKEDLKGSHVYDENGNFDPNNKAYLYPGEAANLSSDLNSIRTGVHERINAKLRFLEVRAIK